jgi:hypothetical protein
MKQTFRRPRCELRPLSRGAGLTASRKHDATFAVTPRLEAKTRRDELDERLGISGHSLHSHLAEFGVREFKGPAGLARDFGDGFAQRLAVEGERVLLAGRRVRASRADARRAPCATLGVAPGEISRRFATEPRLEKRRRVSAVRASISDASRVGFGQQQKSPASSESAGADIRDKRHHWGARKRRFQRPRPRLLGCYSPAGVVAESAPRNAW